MKFISFHISFQHKNIMYKCKYLFALFVLLDVFGTDLSDARCETKLHKAAVMICKNKQLLIHICRDASTWFMCYCLSANTSFCVVIKINLHLQPFYLCSNSVPVRSAIITFNNTFVVSRSAIAVCFRFSVTCSYTGYITRVMLIGTSLSETTFVPAFSYFAVMCLLWRNITNWCALHLITLF